MDAAGPRKVMALAASGRLSRREAMARLAMLELGSSAVLAAAGVRPARAAAPRNVVRAAC